MTNYLPPPGEQQYGAQQADLLRRIATLEQQVNHLVTGAIACTSSTRPSNPAAGAEIYETDTKRLLVWSGSAWENKAFAAFVCTSSTRPASPFQGMQIYETDTTRYLVYSGSAWEQKAFGTFVCTSSTHPSSPFTGLEIYETDTGATAVYSGSGWLYQASQIATQTLGGTASSVTFSSIPAYTSLSLVWRARLSAAGATDMHMQIDGATGSSYLWSKIEASNGVANAAHSGGLVAFINIGVISGDTASYMGSGQQTIAGWASSTGYLTTSGTYTNYDTSTTDWSGTAGGQYNAVGAHTSLKLLPAAGSFAAGSQFSLYGLM